MRGRASRPTPALNCRGQLAERGGESKVVGLVGRDLVVVAAQVLHERMARGD
jgi:hypothetical protein